MDFMLLAIGVVIIVLVGILAKIRMLVQVGIGATTIAAILKYWEFVGQRPSMSDILLGYLIASVVGFSAGFIVGRRQNNVVK